MTDSSCQSQGKNLRSKAWFEAFFCRFSCKKAFPPRNSTKRSKFFPCSPQKIFIERNIGDHNNYQSDDSTMTSTELLRMFSRQKKRNQQGIQNGTGDHFRAELPVDDPGILDVFAGQTHESYERAVTTESHSGFETEVTLKGSPPSTPINMFSKREPPQLKADILPMTFDPRSLFNNSSKRVPENSDAESND